MYVHTVSSSCPLQANGKIVYEGLLKLYWGLKHPITLSSSGVPGNRHRQSVRGSMMCVDDDAYGAMIAQAESEKRNKDLQLGVKISDIVSSGWDSKGACST